MFMWLTVNTIFSSCTRKTQSKFDKIYFLFFDNIFHLNVHYVSMLVQHFELQGRCLTNFHYYYYKQ